MRVDIHKCAIVGCGNVGATTAFSLMQSGLFSEMVLIDVNKKRAHGEAADLGHALPFLSPMDIFAGDWRDVADAGIIVIAAGVAQKPGETRLDLLRANTRIFADIIGEILKYNEDAVLLVVTNPVDVLTEVTRRLSSFPAARVIGSGTVLDTARLKYLLGRRLGVDSRNVHAFIIGEHGDSELPVFSSANISGIDFGHFCEAIPHRLEPEELEDIFVEVRDAAYDIIAAKGATYYAVAEAVRRIVTAIVRDEEAVLPVSVAAEGHYGFHDISISLPAVIGRRGVLRVLDVPLDKGERERLWRSAAEIEQALDSLQLPDRILIR